MKKMRTTRRSVFYAAIASLPLLLAACAEQAETPGAGSAATPITVTIATDGTRAAIDLQSVQIAEGQQLLACFPAGVTLADGTASPCTTTYTVGEANAVTPDKQPYLQAGERSAAIHLLYAPDTGTGTDSWPNGAYPTADGTFTVKQDQSADDNYRKSDLMYGTANAVRTGATAASAAVTMRHLMSKLVVTATAGAGISQVKAIYVVAGYRGMSVAVSNGAVTLGAAGTSAIDATAEGRLTMLSGGTSTTATAAALLPPQTIEAGALIAVETDMGTVNYALPAARQLMTGEVSTFDVTPSRSDLGQTVTLPDAHKPAGSDTHRNRLAFHLADGTTFNMVFVEGGRMENLHSNQATTGYTSGYNVTMSDFYMAETETTQGLWKAVMGGLVNANGATLQSYDINGNTIYSGQAGSGPGPVVSDNYPVGNIQWPHVLTLSGCFIDKLNAATIGQRPPGWEFTLPTSAQFEYAARGGQHSAGFKYAGSDTAGDVIWYAGNTGTAPKPVATNQPNELGLYDMQGNLFEVCSDWQPGTTAGSMNITAGEYTNPTGPASAYDSDQDKWWFGPGWNNDIDVTESYFNYGCGATNGGPTYTDWVRGFRVALVQNNLWTFYYNGVDGIDGTIQTFAVPRTGKYKIECWGSQGGYGFEWNDYTYSVTDAAGRGGYTYGTVALTAGQTLYIACGGRGALPARTSYVLADGGWNGGGKGGGEYEPLPEAGAGGGGATHVATALRGDGQLKNYASYQSEVLLVAGGGGGGSGTFPKGWITTSGSPTAVNWNDWRQHTWNTSTNDVAPLFGGAGGGGGTAGSGVAGLATTPSELTPGYTVTWGGVVSGGDSAYFGQGQTGYMRGNDGTNIGGISGGGGGWYGGTSAAKNTVALAVGGAGGSSHVHTSVINPGGASGVNNGQGMVTITYLGN